MKKVFFLKSCSTCIRIMKELDIESFDKVDIKSQGISESDIDLMHKLSGSYESLFSRKAMKYRSMGLNDVELSEDDYKNHIISEYTFLKRPVFIIGDEIFIGNSKKNIEAVKAKLDNA